MFSFLKNIFRGKAESCKGCCGEGGCKSSGIYEVFDLNKEDIAVLKNLDKRIVIGKVQSIEAHPDPKMTKVRVTKTEVGPGQVETILCGGTNLEEGDIVVVATVGAKLSEDFEIGVRDIRGIESRGMICARSELGFSPQGEEKGQIWRLPADCEMLLGKKIKEL